MVRTEVWLQPDGNARVVQERTYYFDGSFSWAFVDLKKQGADDIVFNRLAEQTPAGWQELKPLELTSTDRSLYIKWGYSAQDEERTFLLDYTVIGAVRRYTDVAEFYWKVVEDEHEPMQEIAVELHLPGPSSELFKVYVHSAARPGTLSFSDAMDQASVWQSGIPRNAFVEVRVLSAPGLYQQASLIPVRRYAAILAQEKRNFVMSGVRKYVFIPLGFVLAVFVPLALLLVFYFRYGREPKLDYQAIYEHEPPRSAPPVTVPVIMHQNPEESGLTQPVFQAMMATLLELARKGMVSVHEVKEGRKTRYEFRLDKPGLGPGVTPLDQTVVDFFFKRVGAGRDRFDEKMLKQYGTNHSTEVRAMIPDLVRQGKEWWVAQLGTEFTEQASRWAYRIFVAAALVCAVLGGFFLGLGVQAIAGGPGRGSLPFGFVIAGAAFAVFILAGRTIRRWHPTAYLEHKRWHKFRKFLTDFSAIEQAPVKLLAIWEQYYVYAVALGVADEFLRHVGQLAERQGAALAMPVWYFGAGTGHGAGLSSFASSMAGFQSFAANLGSMMQSFSTASSSGGGFSGGGGGGGGGGSSGAG
jgi:uncharacterized membrane protein